MKSKVILVVFIFITFELCTFTNSLPSAHFNQQQQQQEHVKLEIEKCVYQASSASKLLKTIYGQCVSMNGPDGCCLEGHYKPGICSNLASICCTKPDPDCTQMMHNKGITRSVIKQRKEYFRKFVQDNEKTAQAKSDEATGSAWRNGHLRLNSHNSPMRINFEVVEMPAHMQLDAVTYVSDALNRKKGDFDTAASYLCLMLDQKYPEKRGVNWSCIVGSKFDYSVEASTGKYMLFYIDSIQVMAYVPKSAVESE